MIMNVVVPIGGRWILVWSVESFYCSTSGISVETSQTSVGCHTNTLRSHHMRYGPTTVIHSFIRNDYSTVRYLGLCKIRLVVEWLVGYTLLLRACRKQIYRASCTCVKMGLVLSLFDVLRHDTAVSELLLKLVQRIYCTTLPRNLVHMHASRPALNKIQNLITQFSRLFSSP